MTGPKLSKHFAKVSDKSRPTPIVFVVDDDVSIRESLEMLVRNEGWQPALFTSAQDFLSRQPSSAPSCLILDVNLPGLSGLDLQQRITSESLAMPIIFITGFGDIPTSVQAMKAGAAEFLTKPVDADVLLQAIRSALDRSRIARDRGLERSRLEERFKSLSKRERQVMTLVVKGLLNKQVGGSLGISEVTVKGHRGRVMEKMQAATLVELVNMAAELGIRTGAED